MATLTGNKPKDTYKGLIKTADSGAISGSKQLSDGEGNLIPISVSTTAVTMTGAVTVNGESLTSFTHDQTTTANSWTITHNMGKYPSVTIVDSANSYVIGNIEYINSNSLTVSFKNAFKGKAYLN